MNNLYTTINSFTQTPSLAQVISYLIYILQITTFYVIIQSHLSSPSTRIPIIILYSIFISVQLIITFITSLSDPSDSFMVKYRNQREKVSAAECSNMLYCDICRSYVQQNSRHCRVCQRCVDDFDHHCMWINNCIGKNNYQMFLRMIGVTFCSMAMYIVSGIVLWCEGRFDEYLVEMGVVWGSGLVIVVFMVLVLNLIILHIYLNHLGLSTYQFIISGRDQKKIADNKQIQQQTLQSLGKPKSHEQQNNLTAKRRGKIRPLDNKQKIINASSYKNVPQIHSQASLKQIGFNTSEIKLNKAIPDVFQERKIDALQQISVADSVNERESINISEFFVRNKSLKLLIKSDVLVPEVQFQNFPKTAKNFREIKAIKNKKK